MIRIAIAPQGFAVTFNGFTYVNNWAALNNALEALKSVAPTKLRRINIHDRDTFMDGTSRIRLIEVDDIDGCIEVYTDGDDIETSYDLLEEGDGA